MRISLKTKVSTFTASIIIIVSGVSTYLFTVTSSHDIERKLIARGVTLSDALSRAAEEGLVAEDLNLIKKASYIVQRKDVALAQVYSTIWEAVDAYPFDRLKDPPANDAIAHFKTSKEPFYKKINSLYDFYSPIFFKPSADSPTIAIGFVRLTLSSADLEKEIRGIIFIDIIVAVIITLIVIAALNVLINRFVLKPLMSLHKSVSSFRDGKLPDAVSVHANDEIGDLSVEFNRMSKAINDRTEKLIESEKRIRTLFERVEHAIFSLDSGGKIIEANSRFIEMFGPVKNLCNLLMSKEKEADCLLKTSFQKVVHEEERVMNKFGNELIILMSLYADTDSSGNVTGYDGYLIDITEKKHLEGRLLRAQRLEAVGTLAGGIAHDFNNLLAAILGYSEILLKKTEDNEELHKPAIIIHEAAINGAELTKKILTVTRKEKLETKHININEVVKGVIELLQRSIPKNVEIITNLQKDIPMLMADPSQIQQVIINLAINARDAMPDGGRFTIETSSVGVENGSANNIAAKGGFVKISVSDTGIGISRETQSKIFDPFFTTKEIGKGTGLGLYIVYSIINSHGGYINVYSEPNKGTRFNVYLPVTKRADIEEETYKTEDLRGTGTLLVIDDDANLLEMSKDMLIPLGYDVLVTKSGKEGLAIFREMKERISLVILDIIMPEMSGREVFQALKTADSQVKILLCSGYSPDGFIGIENLLKSGAMGFIQKPFTRQDIALSIKRVLSA